MTVHHHYDVVCVGYAPALLAAAALLSRRTFRVMVVGEGYLRSHYEFGGLPLARQRRLPLGADLPVFSKMLLELGETTLFRRRARTLDPMFRVQFTAREGLSVPPSLDRLLDLLARSMPAERVHAAAFYPELAEYNAAFDALLGAPASLFQAGLLARRKRERLVRELDRLCDRLRGADENKLGAAIFELVQKSSALAQVPTLAAMRLYGSWTRGVSRLDGDDDALCDLLVDKIRACGGTVMPEGRVLALETKGRRVTTVQLDDARPKVSCDFVLSALPLRELLRKVSNFSFDTRELNRLQIPQKVAERVHVSLSVPTGLVPERFAEENLLALPGHPPIALGVQRGPDAQAPSLLVARADLAPAEVPEARERIAAAVAAAVPRLDRKAQLIDSVHDDAPLWDQRSGKRVLVPRESLRAREAATGRAESIYQLSSDDPFAGERLERLLTNAHIVGPTALPALGVEGELVAAAHAAQIVTKSDRTRERMRRELWSKLELDA